MSKVLVPGFNKLDASLVPIVVRYHVGIGFYDETVPKYVAGTIVLDGVSHPTKYNSYFWWESKLKSGTHTLDLVLPIPGYQFVRWDIFNRDTSELIRQTTELPLTLDINMNTFIQAVVTPVLAGVLEHDPFGFIWYEGLAGWEWVHTGREIPLNKEISLAPGWVNQSEVNIVGHIDLAVTYPDGTTVTLSAAPDSTQDYEAAPGNGYHVGFEPFISSQAGTYTITATLSSAGQVLDSVTFTLEAVITAEGFTYSNLFCDTERVGEDAYGGVAHLIYRATITNPGAAQSRHVRLKFYSHEYNQTYEGVDSFDLSLGPFESHDYDYQRDFAGSEWQIQDMRSGTVYDVWMEDDGGGKSGVISITAK